MDILTKPGELSSTHRAQPQDREMKRGRHGRGGNHRCDESPSARRGAQPRTDRGGRAGDVRRTRSRSGPGLGPRKTEPGSSVASGPAGHRLRSSVAYPVPELERHVRALEGAAWIPARVSDRPVVHELDGVIARLAVERREQRGQRRGRNAPGPLVLAAPGPKARVTTGPRSWPRMTTSSPSRSTLRLREPSAATSACRTTRLGRRCRRLIPAGSSAEERG